MSSDEKKKKKKKEKSSIISVHQPSVLHIVLTLFCFSLYFFFVGEIWCKGLEMPCSFRCSRSD
jgi:hypothetical protein